MHYNSTVAKEHYEQFIGKKPYVLSGVMHSGMKDRRVPVTCGEVIRFGYLGGPGIHKGYPLLQQIFPELHRAYEGRFQLHIFFDSGENRPYLVKHAPYRQNELDAVFREMDVLLVPSIWAETYGLVVPEALMHGVPVIVTENVGAADLLNQELKETQGDWKKTENGSRDMGMITGADKADMKRVIRELLEEPSRIDAMSRSICDAPAEAIVPDYMSYVREIVGFYD
jgi:glycosyltransferase involved in cell wall biosynthesis